MLRFKEVIATLSKADYSSAQNILYDAKIKYRTKILTSQSGASTSYHIYVSLVDAPNGRKLLKELRNK